MDKKKKPKILMFIEKGFPMSIYRIEFDNIGFGIKEYNDYDNLVERVVEENPDIVFCGIVVSGDISGFEAIRILKDDKRIRKIPIVTLIDLDKESEIKEKLEIKGKKYFIREEYGPKKVAEETKKYLIQSGRFNDEDFV